MASYQVVCNVIRPPEPTSVCHISEFQDKKAKHLSDVFQDWPLSVDPVSTKGDDFMLCALVSQTKASFSGSVSSFDTSVRLPFFWCDLCPYATENNASLLEHTVQQHCFVCRHCSFVALSRCAVAQHSLTHHSEFAQQFQDQRLKEYRLERQKFQQCFKPVSSLQPAARKHAADTDAEEASGAGPCKKSRLESNNNGSERVETAGSPREGESLEEVSLCLEQHHLPTIGDAGARSSPECSPAPEISLTSPVLGENIVSSSGMETEPDTKGDGLAPDKSVNLPQNLCENGALKGPSLSSLWEPSVQSKTEQSVPSSLQGSPGILAEQKSLLVIKEEQSGDDEEFACALGKTCNDITNTVNGQQVSGGQSPAHTLQADTGAHGGSVQMNQRSAVVESRASGSPSMNESGKPEEETHHKSAAACNSQNPQLVTVKQEQCGSMEGFSHALYKSFADITEVTRPECGGVASSAYFSHAAAANIVPSKQELDVFAEGEKGPHSSSISSRNVVSPPLSNIRVENLQRQVEESFGMRLPASDSPGVHPVRLFPASSKREVLPELDNFLLDSPHSQLKATGTDPHVFSEGSGEGHIATSMLRQLLTQPNQRPRGVPSVSRSSSCENGDESPAETAQEELQTSSSHRQERTGKSQEQSIDNFLLSPEDTDGKDDLEEFTVTFSESDKNAAAGSKSATQWPEEEDVDATYSPVASSCIKPEPSPSTTGSSHQHSSVADISAMLPAEKLKTYSNMSLRDLLTMKTEISQATANCQEEKKASSTTAGGEVVWECGFCYFADSDKAVVLAHRLNSHTQQEAGFGGGEGNSPRSSEDGDDRWSDTRTPPEEASEHLEREPGQSTSDGGKKASSRQAFSLSSPPVHHKQGASEEAGSRRFCTVRHDDDFDYMSDESSALVESGSEVEDLTDKNYVPPVSLTEVQSSEDEEKTARKGQTCVVKRRRKGLDSKTTKDSEIVVQMLSLAKDNRNQASVENKKRVMSTADSDKDLELCYRCPFCSHPPSSLHKLKSHICYTMDDRHMLMLHRVALPESVRYLCPGDKCTNTYPDGHAYLTHVLPCQGYILDVQERAVQDCVRNTLDKMQRVAGFLNCPVSNCYFVSYFRDQMKEHLNSHLEQVHASQMLLFRSVCSGMARLYSGLAGFDRYLCYCCQALLDSVEEAVKHAQAYHKGRIGGVLHITQRVSNNSRGIVVVALCLRCSNRVPSLDMWFTHQCPKIVSGLGGRPPYKPEPVVPSFQEWLWRTQPSAFKSPTKAKCADRVERGRKGTESSVGQLPLIRSILLAEPPRSKVKAKATHVRNSQESPHISQMPAEESPHIHQIAAEEKAGADGEGHDDVTTMFQCDDCQEFVAETDYKYKHHKCLADTVKAASTSGLGSTNCASTSSTTPASASSTAAPAVQHSALSHSSALRDSSTHISHSKLLSALASLHQNDSSSKHSAVGGCSSSAPGATPASTLTPTLAKALSRAHIPGLSTAASCSSQASKSASVSHPSLISLLTRGQSGASAVLSSQPGEGDPSAAQSDASLPPHNHSDSGMIRSLLMGSRFDSTASREGSGSARPAMAAEPESDSVQKDKDVAAPASLLRSPWMQLQPKHIPAAGLHTSLSLPSVSQGLPETTLLMSQREASPTGPLDPGQSVRSSSAPLMSFLRQQGNHVMQVLGNVLDDQDDTLPS